MSLRCPRLAPALVFALSSGDPFVRGAFADRGPGRHAGGRERRLVGADRETDVASATFRERPQRAAVGRRAPATGEETNPARGADRL